MAVSGSLRDIFRRLFDPPPERPSSPPLGDEWRETWWGDRDADLEYVRGYVPDHENVHQLRFLLYGAVGAGKSSFINSVSNVMRGRMTIPAAANAAQSEKSFTKKFETHRIRKGGGTPREYYPIVFNDIMGLEPDGNQGVRAEDIKLILRGHVAEGYKFNPMSPLAEGDPGYNPSPSLEDRVHVLVCVISANLTSINPSVLEKMASVRETASSLGIPQVAIITNIDTACGETQKNLRNVYRSKHLKRKMEGFSAVLGIPMNCIFPVKNYSHEVHIQPDVDALILTVLRRIVDFGDDFLDKL